MHNETNTAESRRYEPHGVTENIRGIQNEQNVHAKAWEMNSRRSVYGLWDLFMAAQSPHTAHSM